MKKYIVATGCFLFIFLFFFLSFIPDKFILKTKLQEERIQASCKVHSCGLYFVLTPYEWVKDSFNNLFSKGLE